MLHAQPWPGKVVTRRLVVLSWSSCGATDEIRWMLSAAFRTDATSIRPIMTCRKVSVSFISKMPSMNAKDYV